MGSASDNVRSVRTQIQEESQCEQSQCEQSEQSEGEPNVGSCPVANPNPDTMTSTQSTWGDKTKDHLDDLTKDNRGAQIFREYVEQCESGGNQAISSNSLDLEIAPKIGGTTMFYNNKSSAHQLNIYGGDLLVIPSQFFKVINDAQQDLQSADFNTLLAALVESGLTQAISDGEKGKNNWPSVNAVLMDSAGPGDKNSIFLCLHLWPNVSVHWMHMHVYQDDAWNGADSLWNGTNTCTEVKKPDGGWSSLTSDKDSFGQTVQQLATLLTCNMGDGQTGNVSNFGNDSCPTSASDNVRSVRTQIQEESQCEQSQCEQSEQSEGEPNVGSCPVANP